jgi:histone deacetylase 1/2
VITGRTEAVTIADAYTQLLSFEERLSRRVAQHSVNAASRGRGGNQQGRGGSGHGRGGGNRGRGGRPPSNGGGRGNRPTCQLCGKVGHMVADCWYRYDEDFVPEKSAAAAIHGYNTDTNWYADTAATDHNIGELDKLSMRERYNGGEQIYTASGSGMHISHIGHTQIPTSIRALNLNNVLYVPQAKKNLVSIHCLTSDNRAFVELHDKFFLVKDKTTRRPLLQGKCRNGLYPFPPGSVDTRKQAYGAIKPSTSKWHSRLGHPSSFVLQQVIKKHNILCSSESNKETVCDACQQAKSHQLPYPKSSSISSVPLELVYSDV